MQPAGYLLEGGHKSKGGVTCRLPVREDHKGEGCDPLAQATCQRGVVRVRGVTCWLPATCQRGS